MKKVIFLFMSMFLTMSVSGFTQIEYNVDSDQVEVIVNDVGKTQAVAIVDLHTLDIVSMADFGSDVKFEATKTLQNQDGSYSVAIQTEVGNCKHLYVTRTIEGVDDWPETITLNYLKNTTKMVNSSSGGMPRRKI